MNQAVSGGVRWMISSDMKRLHHHRVILEIEIHISNLKKRGAALLNISPSPPNELGLRGIDRPAAFLCSRSLLVKLLGVGFKLTQRVARN